MEFKSLLVVEQLVSGILDQINYIYSRFDVENKGIVETKEIHKTLKGMNFPLTNREISELVKSMDNTLAGTIEYQTYIDSLQTESTDT